MNKDIKKKWVDALRSGEYKQGRAWLRNGNTFCCLGVLCDLAAKEGVIEPPTVNRHGFYEWVEDDREGYRWSSLPPEAVREWAGLGDDPNVPVGSQTLTGLNDTGSTFAQIANLIEEQL